MENVMDTKLDFSIFPLENYKNYTTGIFNSAADVYQSVWVLQGSLT